jgi:SAM-dependent methyltransferase
VSPDSRPPTAGSLTDEAFWNRYWEDLRLPREIIKGTSLYIDAITDVFDQWFQRGKCQAVLEIGGAPGQYGAYVHRRFGHRLHVLDNSSVGCAATRRNLQLLGIDGDVTQGDMFDATLELPLFDVVYSLGLIEHFTDLEAAVAAHVRFVKPGGLLICGCPNFLGINGLVLRRMAPNVVSSTETENMDIRTWARFERNLRLEPLFKGYIGGFEPEVIARSENSRWIDRVGVRWLRALAWLLGRRRLRILRRLNSRAWSGYVMGVYRVPTDVRP